MSSTDTSVSARLLAAADELFYQEGTSQVGIDRVIERAGVAKMSLYRTFGSKEQLIAAYLDQRHRLIMHRLTGAIDSRDSARDKIVALFEAQGRWVADPEYRGCSFTRATAESGAGDDVRRAVRRYRIAVRDLLTQLATAGDATDPRCLALQLFALYQGLSVAHEMPRKAEAVQAVRTAVKALLDASVIDGAARPL